MIAPLHDFASLSAHFAEHDYPPPHPFAQLFPRMTEAEQEALTASIRINEMLDDVTTFNGQIADGNGRCVSAIELGFPWDRVRKTEFDGDEAALLQFVIDKNLSRRHLNESQRAMAAARLANMTQGARTDRPHIAQICAMSQQQAADRLNVSRQLVVDAVKIQAHGVQELQDAVDSGILTVSAAIQVIELVPDKQREMVANSLARPKPAKAFASAIRNAET